jgi:2-polyprenyl-6-methoxyphenol hydroxylase-like FAD-dependent oxidoreductase
VGRVSVTTGARPRVRFHHAGEEHALECRLVVGADGRSSTVRRQSGIRLVEDPVDHLIAGLLVEGATDWPEAVQSTGKFGDIFYLVFPQSAGKIRLYADYDLAGRGRFAGAEGARRFLAAFDMPSVPHSAALAAATPAGPCNSLPSQDAWTERPFAEGVVLVGDAAGYNDPIIGQGLSITLRDVRIVRDLLTDGGDWRPSLFEPYAAERLERSRRLRLSARFVTHMFAKFDGEAIERRKRARQRLNERPELLGLLIGTFAGPDTMPPHLVTEEAVEAVFAP